MRNWRDEDYGQLWSRRLWGEQGDSEIELGLASLSWADVGDDPARRFEAVVNVRARARAAETRERERTLEKRFEMFPAASTRTMKNGTA